MLNFDKLASLFFSFRNKVNFTFDIIIVYKFDLEGDSMRGNRIRIISIVLAVILAFTCIAITGVSVSASTSSAGDVVYFDNSVTKWSTVYAYMWTEGSGDNKSWPGIAMTNISGDIWGYNITGNYNQIIFNNGSGGSGNQSNNLNYQGNNMIATATSSLGAEVTWTEYTGDETMATTASTATQATESTSGSSTEGEYTVYLKNDANWSTVYAYMWTDGVGNNQSWPGIAMTSIGGGVWEYTLPRHYANVVFNNGDNGIQTADLTYPGNGYIFNNSTNTWSAYDLGPVKITNFSTDIASPTYTTCSIVISASASSSQGDVTYKFTATNSANQTAVLYEGTSNMVAWVPTVAGTYTLGVEVTDTAGNTNSRTMIYEVGDASTLVDVYVRFFSTSYGTGTQIEKGSAVSFTMDAIGGKVGTNLLFYKFAITAPDNTTNIAYYTTSDVYTYTPTQTGQYTIKVSVQNSNNKTITKTYQYQSVDEITDSSESTIPTSVTTPSSSSTAPTSAPTTESSSVDSTPKLGDVNQDGTINIMDVTCIQKYLAKLDCEFYVDYADTTGDGIISIKDATRIQKYLIGLISSL